MNNVLVYCEVEFDENIKDYIVAEVSLELLSKGKKLANQLNCKLEAFIAGDRIDKLTTSLFKYGVDTCYYAEEKSFYPYITEIHSKLLINVIKNNKPQIALIGATSIGRDLGPRIASTLKVGLTADCTDLVIGEYTDKKLKKDYKDYSGKKL